MYDFLNKAFEEKRNVTVITTNGFQMHGIISGVDAENRTITLEVDGNEQLIFMSAISTIK